MSPQAPAQHKPAREAHVTVEDNGRTTPKTVPAGSTPFETLRSELGVDADGVLWLRRGNERSLIDVHSNFDVEDGDHFIVVRGGGVS